MNSIDKGIVLLVSATILGACGGYLKGQPEAAGELLLSVALFVAILGTLEAVSSLLEMCLETWHHYKAKGENA